MSEIQNVLDRLNGTLVYDVLVQIEQDYKTIYEVQKSWYEKTNFLCPDSCGKCCINFEPDLMEAEALYMAAWLIENQNETAKKISEGTFPFDNGKTCPLYNPDSDYHCSIYGGRGYICRFFGASSFYSKDHEKIWKPCKHYPESLLKKHNPPLEHRQYSKAETENFLGEIPPAMSDLLESSASFGTDSKKTFLLREILPAAIKRIYWLLSMNDNNNPNGSPNGTPTAPKAA